MFRFILHRLGMAVPTLLLISVIVFALIRLIPGDPALLMLGDMADPQSLANMRSSLGLDHSVVTQYLIWIKSVLSGDLGVSISSRQPVLDLLVERFSVSATVVLVAVLSALNSGLYVSSRILFGLSQRGDAPAQLAVLTARKVPRAAVLLSSVIGYIAIMAAIISPQGVFLFLVNASGAVMLFVYLAVALAQIKVRRQVEATAPSRLTLRMWLFPWLSYAVVAVIAGVLVAMAFQQSLRTQFLASLVSLGVVSAAYWLLKRRRQQTPTAHVSAIDILAGLSTRS